MFRKFVHPCIIEINVGIHSLIPLACAGYGDFMPFSGAASIPLCYIHFPATVLHPLFK
jgi:hypothetical protein